MKSKISICFLTIVVILLALVMIEKINTQRAADKAAIIAQSNENDKEEKVIYYQEVKPWKFEKKSRHTLLGLPLYHICFQGTRMGGRMNFKMTTAKGVLAIGCKAKGILIIGIVARGLLSLGVASAGLFSFGAVSLGLISLGALSVGLVAGGNICVGVIAFGNLAVGVYSLGNCAVANKIALGNYAHAHIAIGNSVHGVKELLLQDSNFSDMNPAIVKKMILGEFPKVVAQLDCCHRAPL